MQASAKLLGGDVNPYLILTSEAHSNSASLADVPGDVVFRELKDWFGMSGNSVTFTATAPLSTASTTRLTPPMASVTYFSNISALAQVTYPLPDLPPQTLEPVTHDVTGDFSGSHDTTGEIDGGGSSAPWSVFASGINVPPQPSGDSNHSSSNSNHTSLIAGLVAGMGVVVIGAAVVAFFYLQPIIKARQKDEGREKVCFRSFISCFLCPECTF